MLQVSLFSMHSSVCSISHREKRLSMPTGRDVITSQRFGTGAPVGFKERPEGHEPHQWILVAA